jgi:hypothetical protein
MNTRKEKGLVSRLGAVSLAMVVVAPTLSFASIPANFGFEDGLAGWMPTFNGGSASVVDSFTAPYMNSFTQYEAPEGESFLLFENGTTGKSVKVSQGFDLTEGDILRGFYAFSAPGVVFDLSAATVGSDSSFEILSTASLLTNFFSGPGWQTWEWVAPATDSYTITYLLYNTPFDGNGRSFAMFDGEVAPVPVPGAVWLLGSALMGLLGIGARKKISRMD